MPEQVTKHQVTANWRAENLVLPDWQALQLTADLWKSTELLPELAVQGLNLPQTESTESCSQFARFWSCC
jgi:hypothetical protein